MSYIIYKVRVYENGNKRWVLNGKLHRENGPAVEHSDGAKWWYLNGIIHREDGPAVEWADGNKSWHLEGIRYTEEQWKAKLNSNCEGKVVEIEGKKYKLVGV